MPFVHPRLPEIERYTAWRLGCSLEVLKSPDVATLVADPDLHPCLNNPYSATHPDVICFFRYGATTLLRINANPSPAAQRVLQALSNFARPEPQHVLAMPGLKVHQYPVDPYFYLDPRAFTPARTASVRLLTSDDRTDMEQLHAGIEADRRWYVEIDHPVVFGCFVDRKLVAAASHFLFEDYGIAAPGVLTHTDFRQRGYGKAVVSAAVQWALERDWIVEWCTNERNAGSMGIANGLGFSRFAEEAEVQVLEAT